MDDIRRRVCFDKRCLVLPGATTSGIGCGGTGMVRRSLLASVPPLVADGAGHLGGLKGLDLREDATIVNERFCRIDNVDRITTR